jgi:hypothetical protein
MKPGVRLFTIAAFLVAFAPEPNHVFAADNPPSPAVSGMVWERHGEWHLNGGSGNLRLGEAISPGGLLTASPQATPHSITVLLPDGQRMLCECYEPGTCSQGFRVPAITPQPSPAVWAMFLGVRNALLLRPESAETAFAVPVGRAASTANVEMVGALSPQGSVSIAAALRALPGGEYSLKIAGDWPGTNPQPPSSQSLKWAAGHSPALVHVGGQGVYRIRISDSTNVPRIDVEVLAVSPPLLPSEIANLQQARETILRWSKIHEGWSLHSFLRVCLQARAIALAH